MKGLVIHRYGGPDVMQLEERDPPAVGPRDVLIDVRAASLNPIDFKIRQGALKMVRPRRSLPIALGCDVAGVVREVGAGARGFATGDEVFARLEKGRMGGLSEQAVADVAVVAKKPAKASFEEAASLPLAGLTALQALREAAALRQGQRVLIHAGAGGVGSLAIQIAKVVLGLWVATTTSGKNLEFVRGLGADLVIDYTAEQVSAPAHWVDADMLRPVLHRTYPLAEFREAFAELERGHARGKIVVSV